MQDVTRPQLNLDGEIWRFALEFYGAPGVSETCLRLQDEAGFDIVNMIVILYADAKLHRRLTADQVNLLKCETQDWRDEAVLPLRRLRRRLKAPPAEFPPEKTQAFRNLIKKAELRSEQIQLAVGERWLSTVPAGEGLTAEAALLLLRTEPFDTSPADLTKLISSLMVAVAKIAAVGN